jgi:hypoxanthine phosphoribosyltransferase
MAVAGQAKLKVLIRRAAIQKRVREVAQQITKDFKGQRVHIIGVEDILDTGVTLSYLIRVMQQRRPKVLHIAALLDKPSRRIKEVKAHYVGFTIPNEFVVGYGLDYAERYRNLKDVCVLSLPPE